MRANIRSISGAILMLVIIPFLAGLLACLPVPIGDPERSRIDPAMSGWWAMEGETETALCVLRPYDKRTWLVIFVLVEKGDSAEIEEPDIKTAGDLLAVLGENEVGPKGIIGGAPAVYKAWLTRLGGERFLTWEPVAAIEDIKTFSPEAWFVFRIGEQETSYVELVEVDSDYDAFEALMKEFEENEIDPWKARKDWERVIRRHVDDPDMYFDDPIRLRRLPDELARKAAKLVSSPFDY